MPQIIIKFIITLLVLYGLVYMWRNEIDFKQMVDKYTIVPIKEKVTTETVVISPKKINLGKRRVEVK
jgi:hypothetical protein